MLHKLIHFFIAFLPFVPSNTAFAQTFSEGDFGGNIGLTVDLGTHFREVGITINTYYRIQQVQINTQIRWQKQFCSFAQLKGNEWLTSIGILYGFGKTDSTTNYFLSPVSNQTYQTWAVGYAYQRYFDNHQTSQGGGLVALEFNRWGFVMENDLLGSAGEDRYRTGAFAFYWRDEYWQFAINNTLWTGDANGAPKVQDTNYKARYGYLNMRKQPLGLTSHGILALQAQYALPYGQIAQANMGIDSERIRNTIQNKLIHDLYFIPKNWNKTENYHIPMLNRSGDIFTYQKQEQIRKSRFFFQTSLNNTWFY